MSCRINLGKLCPAIPWSVVCTGTAALQYSNVIPPAGSLAVPTIHWKLRFSLTLPATSQAVKVTVADDGQVAAVFERVGLIRVRCGVVRCVVLLVK